MGHIEDNLKAARPSSDPKFAEKVQRLIRPEALKQKKPWMWSPGIGADVWEMFCACITGDLEAVMRLLDKDPSLVRSHFEYCTPLSFAVRENHVEVATYLLGHAADPLALGDVLQVARDRGYVEMDRLLESKFASLHGADLNARDEEFCSTPLAWVARCGQTRMVEFLLRHGAQPSLPDDLPDLAWATPLTWVRKKGYADIEADMRHAGAR